MDDEIKIRVSDIVFALKKHWKLIVVATIAGTLFGENAITGRLPFQIPASMDQVLNQREDMPKDIADPLYEYGFGIDAESFGR